MLLPIQQKRYWLSILRSTARVGKLYSVDQTQCAANIYKESGVIGIEPCSFIYILSLTALILQMIFHLL